MFRNLRNYVKEDKYKINIMTQSPIPTIPNPQSPIPKNIFKSMNNELNIFNNN